MAKPRYPRFAPKDTYPCPFIPKSPAAGAYARKTPYVKAGGCRIQVGRLAKIDALYTRVLAHFAKLIQPDRLRDHSAREFLKTTCGICDHSFN